MARGQAIIVSAPTSPRGVFMEGYINAGETPKPGTILQIDQTQALKGGRHVWKIYSRGADGDRPNGPLIILLPDSLQGKLVTDAYAAGERCFGYVPVAGEEFNMLVLDVSGTADIAAGTLMMIDNTTGKLIATTGSPESEPFTLLEVVSAPAADVLTWCIYSGY